METLLCDLRHGLRRLVQRPAFTFPAIITLAIGIGANTAIFSVVSAVLLHPLPFVDPGRLVYVQETARRESVVSRPVSYPNFLDWKEQNDSFAALAALNYTSFALSGNEWAERIYGEAVSAGYFSMLGTQMALGRAFRPEEDRLPAGEPVAVLSHTLWQRRLGGNPEALGGTVRLDGRDYTVVGIAPRGFRGLSDDGEVWIPFTSDSSVERYLSLRGSRWHEVIGRLRAGVSLEQARSEMDTIALRLEQEYLDVNEDRGVRLMSLSDAFFVDFHRPLLVLLGAVGLVLLIACANVANLTLARAMGRRREVAIRAALGAGRVRIVRHLLTESMLLALLGGSLGVILASWGTDLLMQLPVGLPQIAEVRIDAIVLFFSLSLVVLTGLLSGLLPAWHLSRAGLLGTLTKRSRSGGAGPGTKRLRGLLVVCELALALVLLIGAGLLLRSFQSLRAVDPGFRPHNVLTARLRLPPQAFTIGRAQNFALELQDRVAALPSVDSVAVGSDLPLGGGSSAMWMTIDGAPVGDDSGEPRIYEHLVSPDFFTALGIRLVRGRDFTRHDTAASPRVIIISESASRRFWPDEEPIGKRLKRGQHDPDQPWLTVVGVVSDVRYRSLTASQDNDPDIYFPLAQIATRTLSLAVRSSADPASLTGALRGLLKEMAPDLPLYRVATMEDILADRTASDGVTTVLLGGFALTALLLASVGIYGVISYSVNQRTHEIGVRLALGAQRFDILRMVLRQGMLLTVIGIGIGLASALGAATYLESLLFGVEPTDPLTYAGITGLLLTVALLACYFPARRATRVDPMVALRYE